MQKKRMLSRLVLVIVASVVVLGLATSAEAKKGCTNASLSGTYGMLLTGTWAIGPVADVGQVVSDGNGNLTGSDTVSLNGTVLPTVPFTGTYQISSGCTGTLSINATGFPPLNLNLSLVNGGSEILLIETDQGTTVTGTATSF